MDTPHIPCCRLAILLCLNAALSVQAARTWKVDDDRVQYPHADFTTLADAVAAAAAGDKVVVYPGLYDAHLTIEKALTISGPKSGKDGRTRTVIDKDEAILQTAGGLHLVLGANDIVLDGFLVRIPTMGFPQDGRPGVILDPNFSGERIINNVFDHSGIEANSSGRKRSSISRSRFENDGQFNGVFTVAGPGVALQECDFIDAPVWFSGSPYVVVAHNKFSGPALADETATLHLRQCYAPLVEDNAFAADADLGLTELENALVRKNMFRTGRIWITLQNSELVVEKNRLSQCAIGIFLNNDGNGPSGAVVRQNEIKDGDLGLFVSGDAFGNLLQENNIEDNRIGILVSNPSESFIAMNTFRRNTVRGNSEIDCIDMTTGTGTSGTANIWEGNEGSTCSPPGLCAD